MIESKRFNHYILPHPLIPISAMTVLFLLTFGIILFF